jgi:hypothetical protein
MISDHKDTDFLNDQRAQFKAQLDEDRETGVESVSDDNEITTDISEEGQRPKKKPKYPMPVMEAVPLVKSVGN